MHKGLLRESTYKDSWFIYDMRIDHIHTWISISIPYLYTDTQMEYMM